MYPSRDALSELPGKEPHGIEVVLARRRGILKGAHLLEAPLKSASFGTFLAETRKGYYHSFFVSIRATTTALMPPASLPTIMAGSISGANPAVNPR